MAETCTTRTPTDSVGSQTGSNPPNSGEAGNGTQEPLAISASPAVATTTQVETNQQGSTCTCADKEEETATVYYGSDDEDKAAPKAWDGRGKVWFFGKPAK
jgi:hypothetical protein